MPDQASRVSQAHTIPATEHVTAAFGISMAAGGMRIPGGSPRCHITAATAPTGKSVVLLGGDMALAAITGASGLTAANSIPRS